MKRKEQTIVEKEIPGREHAGYAYIYPLDGGARQEYVLEMTPENIANLYWAPISTMPEKIILTDMLDNLILDTAGGFIMNCPDQILCGRVLPLLAPIQMGRRRAKEIPVVSRAAFERRMLPRRTSLAHSSEVAHMEIRRGDIYYADLTPVVGCEQGGRRPVLVIQNDVGNHHGSTVIVAAITSRRRRKRRLPHPYRAAQAAHRAEDCVLCYAGNRCGPLTACAWAHISAGWTGRGWPLWTGQS